MEVSGGLRGGFSLWTSRTELERLRGADALPGKDDSKVGSSSQSLVLSSEIAMGEPRSSLEAEGAEMSLREGLKLSGVSSALVTKFM